MLGMFKRTAGASNRSAGERTLRHSRGWGEMKNFLSTTDGLRVLDFGSTSPANISFLTELGHSVYMSDAVTEAASPEWRRPAVADPKQEAKPEFEVEQFCASNLSFSGRVFDVILLWDTANYLPPELVAPLFRRLQAVLTPGGRLLAFFQARKTGPETEFSRYQLTPSEDLIVLRSGPYPIEGLYQTRQVQQFLDGFQDVRFFLGKDNIREVYAVR